MIGKYLRDRVRANRGTDLDAIMLLKELEECERKLSNERIGFRGEIAHIINKYSRENGSETPDYALAEFIDNSLFAFDVAVNAREVWYKRDKPNPAINWKESTEE